jgi:golgin subfamily B member 1
VEPVARAIGPLLEPPSIARLKQAVFAFIEQGGRTHLRRWAMAADRTAARAGLLLSNDLNAARTMLEREDPRRAPALYEDLIVFASSDRYSELRHRLGIAVG